MEYRKIMVFILLTLSISANDKNQKNGDNKNKPPLRIFNYVYSGSKSDAKNKPFHLSNQESKIKQQKSSSFFEKLLSITATTVGVAAGSVYIIRNIFRGKNKKSTEDLKREIEQLKALIKKLNTMQKFKEILSKMCIISNKKKK